MCNHTGTTAIVASVVTIYSTIFHSQITMWSDMYSLTTW